LIDRLGYDGWIGCEYRPATTVEAALRWMKAYHCRRRTKERARPLCFRRLFA
jgi:hypothetical protein